LSDQVLKKIRIDYFHYRIKKDKVDVLLGHDESTGEYSIPFRYVMENEKIGDLGLTRGNVEDDGDVVILDCKLNDSHLNKNGKQWFPLFEIVNLPFSRVKSWRSIQHGLAIFLDLCPKDETSLFQRIESVLERLLTENAKKKYVEELQYVLDGGSPSVIYMDAYMTQPDPQLLKKEIETLSHFRLRKLHDKSIYRMMDYSYDSIDWEAFGAEIHSISEIIMDPIPGDCET